MPRPLQALPRPTTPSLKGALLLWLLPGLLLILGVSLAWSTHFLRTQVDDAHDRALAGALRAINYNISTASGGLAVEQPFLLLTFFELAVDGQVYFRVSTDDGLAEIGTMGLPMPDQELEVNAPLFYDTDYLGDRVRVAALLRDASPPIAGREGSRIVVQVAETLRTRDEVDAVMLRRAITRDVLLLIFSVVLVVAGTVMALRPLLRLRRQLDARQSDDLSPIDNQGLPREVRPLVDSINHLVSRYADMARAQRQFLDDASHQLRTPLAVLRTQMIYALREHDPAEMRSALQAMEQGLTRAERLTQQMLSLARTRDAAIGDERGWTFASVDLAALARDVVTTLWPLARSRDVDLGLDVAGTSDATATLVSGVEWLLREAVSNLVDNAIRYTPAGGQVTLSVRTDASGCTVCVVDSGGGMSADDLRRAGARFRRGAAGKRQPGAGLGLAIVQAIAELHGTTLKLANIEGEDPCESDSRGNGCVTPAGLQACVRLQRDRAAPRELPSIER